MSVNFSESAPDEHVRGAGEAEEASALEPHRATLRDGGIRQNPFWAAVVLSGIAFVVICLTSVAAGMGEPEGPMNKVMTRHGTTMIIAAAICLIASGLLAMTIDRYQTLRRAHENQPR